ncbi:MAG: sodium:alanine symporter family protein [Prevotellaceae bacterium]|nr:sodium:alanine symporter family protein [Prevotellaceae bacterium]
MEEFSQIISNISGAVWGWPMIVLLVGTHLFLTIRLKCPQRKIWTAIKLSVKPDKGSNGDVSHFGALATSLAATIGTGNIVGIATAISLGGPGAVFWCFFTGLFGIATKYGEGLLAVKYRVKTSNGEMIGGPMYALERGVKCKWLAVLFCIFTAFAAFGIGNAVQSKAISENLSQFITFADKDTVKLIIGVVIAALVAVVIFGGVKSISKICTFLIPIMAVLYVFGCIYILIVNSEYVWPAICWIVNDAFSLKAGIGGAAGSAIMTTMRYGIARGLFSNESGLGSAPIVAAAAQSKNPVRQALVLSSGAFWDTVLICTMTGLTVVSSILAYDSIDIKSTGVLTEQAFGMIPYIGTPILTFGLVTFAFSTILGWCYYGEKAVEYLWGKRFITLYRVLWVLVVIVGSSLSLTVVWDISDILNAFMSVPNLISLIVLSGIIAKETQHYLWDDHLDEEGQ